MSTVIPGALATQKPQKSSTSKAVPGTLVLRDATGGFSLKPASVVDADISGSAAISLSKLATGALPVAITVASANIVDETITNADINSAAAIDKTKISGTAITAADTGTVTSTMILNGTIVDADINASAGITHSKLATVTAGSVLLGNASNVATATALTGDVTVTSAGVTAIGSGVIVNDDINASAAIALSKLATGALPTAITVTTGNMIDASVTQAKLATNVASNGPAFRAYSGTTTTVAPATATRINFNTESFDTNSNFASNRFTPTVAGYYQINATLEYASPYAANASAQIYKNGGAYSVGNVMVGTTANADVSDIVYCNGTTDYVEIYSFHSSASNRTVNASSYTYFSGCLVRAA